MINLSAHELLWPSKHFRLRLYLAIVLATWNSKYDVLSSTDELIMNDARGHYHPGKWIAFQQNFCIQLATNFCQVTLIFTRVNIFVNWYQSTHSLITNTTPDHCRYFATLATTKTSRSPNFVRLSPNVNFPILSDYHLSFIRKYNRFPVIYLPGKLLSTPRHTASSINPAYYNLFPNFPSGKTTGTQTTSHSTWW